MTTATPTCATPDDGRRDITGGAKAREIRCGVDGTQYIVETTVDDDPAVPLVQVYPGPSPVPNLKEITIRVTPVSPEGQTSAGQDTWVLGNPTWMVFRRVRGN